ncbi:MAG: type II toxin-antitoxin system VapC family toxin [Opitutales bacterium]|nr:type II toxin-antitoxin system VapC family toxin [Opitutales bacterium]
MILLDTNVLIYGFDPDSPLHSWARGIIRSSLLGDGAAITPVILAEYLVGEEVRETVIPRLSALGIALLDLPALVAPRCAEAYARYLENRRDQASPPAPKSPLPDFFIGAHAAVLSLPLATADADRYQTYFPEIELITPDSTRRS